MLMNKKLNKNVEVKFLGAAGTVTGSCYMITHPGGRFLVDCGLFQGTKSVRELNYARFPFEPDSIDFVVLTHAHVDHSGLVPKLVKLGFRNEVYATEGTRDLLTYMLPDSGYIHETEVKRINRRNMRRGDKPIDPIYTKSDGERALDFIVTQPYEKTFEATPGVTIRFWNAGHILGSSSVEVTIETEERPLKLLFSGDIGPDEKSFHKDPDAPTDIDYLFVESTYGDRERQDLTLDERRDVLKQELLDGLSRGGNVLIPAFAVERTQELLYDIGLLLDDQDLPPVTVYLDSPLAIRATEVFEMHAATLHDVSGRGGLFRNSRFQFVNRADDSMALDRITGGAIIIAASGMCDAGRIRYHLKSNLWRPQATVLFVGYQAAGSLGATLLNGTDTVRIHGREITVKARIRKLDCYSAHADQAELVSWVTERLPVERGIFITHGEDMARATLRDHLVAHGCKPKRLFIPQLDETFVLSLEGKVKHARIKPRIEHEDFTGDDWHNDYASFLVRLSDNLRRRESDFERNKTLKKLSKVLDKMEAGE